MSLDGHTVPQMDVGTDLDGSTECEDFKELVESLVQKCSVSSRKEKIQILTLVTDCWNCENPENVWGEPILGETCQVVEK